MENKAPQMLQQWLDEQERNASWLSRKLSVAPSALTRWLNVEGTVPTLENRRKLKEITGLPIDIEGAWL